MKKKTIIFVFLIGVLYILGNIFCNPTNSTAVESNNYLTPASSAFDDDNFYKCITDTLGVTEDTNVTDEQLASIERLECSDKDIYSVKGLEKLVNIQFLDLTNNILETIDVSDNKKLMHFALTNNSLTELDIRNNQSALNVFVDDNVKVYDINNYGEEYIIEGNNHIVTVSNDISKLAACMDYETSDSLCLPFLKYVHLQQSNNIFINGINYHSFPEMFGEFKEKIENECGDGECKIYDNNGKLIAFFGPSDNFFSLSQYLKVADLGVGENTLEYTFNNKTYKITIIRKDKKPEIIEDDIVEEDRIEDNNGETNTANNIIEEIITNPDTGIALSMGLSLLAVGILFFMYYRYYRKKVNN